MAEQVSVQIAVEYIPIIRSDTRRRFTMLDKINLVQEYRSSVMNLREFAGSKNISHTCISR